jgi:hypothetical protein
MGNRAGSNPVSRTIFLSKIICAGVMELADVQDSKSCGGSTVWVRPPSPAFLMRSRISGNAGTRMPQPEFFIPFCIESRVTRKTE